MIEVLVKPFSINVATIFDNMANSNDQTHTKLMKNYCHIPDLTSRVWRQKCIRHIETSFNVYTKSF